MAKRSTALTGAAGEHFVAYHLSAMGYPVALTRGGSPTVDLMIGDLHGNAAVSVQVKTATSAWWEYKRKPQDNCWMWDVGARAIELRGENIFYAFVDLKWNLEKPVRPDVFVVPSKVVADLVKPKWKRYVFWIMAHEADLYRERWDILTDRLRK